MCSPEIRAQAQWTRACVGLPDSLVLTSLCLDFLTCVMGIIKHTLDCCEDGKELRPETQVTQRLTPSMSFRNAAAVLLAKKHRQQEAQRPVLGCLPC